VARDFPNVSLAVCPLKPSLAPYLLDSGAGTAQRNIVLDGVSVARGDKMTMRPFAKLLWTLVTVGYVCVCWQADGDAALGQYGGGAAGAAGGKSLFVADHKY